MKFDEYLPYRNKYWSWGNNGNFKIRKTLEFQIINDIFIIIVITITYTLIKICIMNCFHNNYYLMKIIWINYCCNKTSYINTEKWKEKCWQHWYNIIFITLSFIVTLISKRILCVIRSEYISIVCRDEK